MKLPLQLSQTVENEFSLEEVKEKFLLTKEIKVSTIPLESNAPIPCPTVQEEKTIQEIIAILSNSYIPLEDWWYTLERTVNYHLELVNETSEVFATVQAKGSSPLELKGKGFAYSIYSDEKQQLTDILMKICEDDKNE